MSLLWRLLSRRPRAGEDNDLPDDIGPDLDSAVETEADELAGTANLLRIKYLSDADFIRAANALNVDVAAVRAVAEVEAAGRGFLPDGRPQVLFEAHIFHRQTGGRHHPAARDRRGVALSSPHWDRTLYGRAGVAQHERIEDAAAFDWAAAHRAASWGLFQILGTNHAAVGWPTIGGFVDAMNSGAGPHLDAFVGFVQTNRLDGALRRHDWAAFARGYNGPGFAANQYDTKLAAAHARWSRAA